MVKVVLSVFWIWESLFRHSYSTDDNTEAQRDREPPACSQMGSLCSHTPFPEYICFVTLSQIWQMFIIGFHLLQ